MRKLIDDKYLVVPLPSWDQLFENNQKNRSSIVQIYQLDGQVIDIKFLHNNVNYIDVGASKTINLNKCIINKIEFDNTVNIDINFILWKTVRYKPKNINKMFDLITKKITPIDINIYSNAITMLHDNITYCIPIDKIKIYKILTIIN